MKQVDVLMAAPLPPLVRAGLEAKFNVARLWEAGDQTSLIASVASQARIIATGVPILVEGVSRPIDDAFMALFPRLELIANLGVGYDNIDSAAAARRGIVVTNTPDVLTDETADTAMGLLLCAARQLPQADRYLRAGKWLDQAFPLSSSLRGRTMGIIGLGRIGSAIARRGEAFGLKIAYHGRHRQPDIPYAFHPTLVELARACDILMIATPGGPATRHLVDAPILDALGPNGIVINIARGGVVDERALINALRERRILSAGLDVFADEPNVPPELLAMDHVVLTPHVGSASGPTRDAMAQLVVDNIVSFASGAGPLTPVPETPWPALKVRAN